MIIYRSMRLAAYRQFTWWTYNRLGEGNRRVIPSCVVSAIRHEYPEQSGNYTGFKVPLTSKWFLNRNKTLFGVDYFGEKISTIGPFLDFL